MNKKRIITVSVSKDYQKVELTTELDNSTDEMLSEEYEYLKSAAVYMLNDIIEAVDRDNNGHQTQRAHNTTLRTASKATIPNNRINTRNTRGQVRKQNTQPIKWWDGVSDIEKFDHFNIDYGDEVVTYKVLENKQDGKLFGLAIDENVQSDRKYYRL